MMAYKCAFAFVSLFFFNIVATQSFIPHILQDSRDLPRVDGTFGFLYRTEDGIAHAAKGDSNGIVQGRYSYTDPTGLKVNFNYNAGSRTVPGYDYGVSVLDDGQYRPQGNAYSQARPQSLYLEAQPQKAQPQSFYVQEAQPQKAQPQSFYVQEAQPQKAQPQIRPRSQLEEQKVETRYLETPQRSQYEARRRSQARAKTTTSGRGQYSSRYREPLEGVQTQRRSRPQVASNNEVNGL